jgi:hypothetical protein
LLWADAPAHRMAMAIALARWRNIMTASWWIREGTSIVPNAGAAGPARLTGQIAEPGI